MVVKLNYLHFSTFLGELYSKKIQLKNFLKFFNFLKMLDPGVDLKNRKFSKFFLFYFIMIELIEKRSKMQIIYFYDDFKPSYEFLKVWIFTF